MLEHSIGISSVLGGIEGHFSRLHIRNIISPRYRSQTGNSGYNCRNSDCY